MQGRRSIPAAGGERVLAGARATFPDTRFMKTKGRAHGKVSGGFNPSPENPKI